MTRPTAWTTSTLERLGEKKITASSDGTSTPSARQRALVRMRHSPGSEASASQSSFLSRSLESMEPSTWSRRQVGPEASPVELT